MIQNIVFDMGNVLVLYDPLQFIEELVEGEEDRALLLQELFHSTEWLRMDRGRMNEAEVIAAVCARLPANLHSPCAQLCQNWHSTINRFYDMEALVQQLKQKGYGIYLLSNTGKNFHTFRKNIPALEHFDGTFISADCGLMKPDLAIFRAFFEEFGLAPETCFFIDDATANIEAAAECGMQGHIFRRDMAKLVSALQAAGVPV